MIKIGTQIQKDITRYARKNSISGRYERNRDIATLSSLVTGAEISRIAHWTIADCGFTSLTGTIAITSIKQAFKNFIELRPIIKRAKQIKQAQKLAKKV